MSWLLIKYAITAALVVAIGEVARRSDHVGGLVAALPWVTVLALVWMQAEGQSTEKLARHAQYTFWYVVAHAADVFGVPLAAGTLGLLAGLAGQRGRHGAAVHGLGLGVAALGHRAALSGPAPILPPLATRTRRPAPTKTLPQGAPMFSKILIANRGARASGADASASHCLPIGVADRAGD